MKVIIAGGTGLVGKELVKILSADENIETIMCLGRRNIWPQDGKVQVLKVDFDNLEELSESFDYGFCCLGTTIKKAGSQERFKQVDFHYSLNFAKLCQSAGVRVFSLVSSYGANSKSRTFYSRVKGELEEELKALSFEKLQIFQPSLLIGDREEKRFLEDLGQKAYTWGSRTILKPYLGTEVSELVKVMVKAMKDKEKREVEVFGPKSLSS